MLGTTSACAENTCGAPYTPALNRNYLRVRGEYWSERHRKDTIMELPPRARRILIAGALDAVIIGTTSACAENTTLLARRTNRARNYLRVRGEYTVDSPLPVTISELPPRARRILKPHPPQGGLTGTTSACAENTTTRVKPSASVGNYLRVRGEYAIKSIGDIFTGELPPRARRIQS